MTTFEKIRKAAENVNLEAFPDVYTEGDLDRWVTYNFSDERGALYNDDAPEHVIAYVQVHLFLPEEEDFLALRNAFRKALFAMGFTFPEIPVNAIEEDTHMRHIVYEFEDEEEE